MDENPLPLIRLLLARLERISADSVWAHRASGVRGALFKALEKLENGEIIPKSKLEALTSIGFQILAKVMNEAHARKVSKKKNLS
jgi:hypothetical protein